MHPIQIPGFKEVGKPEDMTDEQCTSTYAKQYDINFGPGTDGNVVIGKAWLQAWQPNKEDIEAMNRGEPVYIQIISYGLPPVSLFTLDKNGQSNDAG
jgi:hypothetical protein